VRQPAVATVGAGIWPDEVDEIPHVVHDYVMGWKITTPKHKAEMMELLQAASSVMAGVPHDPYNRVARLEERKSQQHRHKSPPPVVRAPPGSPGGEYAQTPGTGGPWAIDAPGSLEDGGSWYDLDWESMERERLRDGRPTAVEADKLRKEKQRRAERQLKAEQRAVSRGAIRMGKSFKWLGSRDHSTQVKRVDEALKMRVAALNNPNGSTKVQIAHHIAEVEQHQPLTNDSWRRPNFVAAAPSGAVSVVTPPAEPLTGGPVVPPPFSGPASAPAPAHEPYLAFVGRKTQAQMQAQMDMQMDMHAQSETQVMYTQTQTQTQHDHEAAPGGPIDVEGGREQGPDEG